MGKITDQPAATLPLAGTELLTIIQSGENRQTTADAVNFTRPPTPHADTHSTGGTDELTPGDIGAALAVHQHLLADVTDSGTAASYDVGLDIGNVVELIDVDTMGLAGLPAIDGSQLTGLGPGQTNLSVPQGEITAVDLVVRSDTGTDATIPASTVTTAGLQTRDQHNKLAGVEDGATANQSDGYLLERANHTGTQSSSSITLAAGSRLLGRSSAGSGVSELIQIGANLALSGGVLSGTATVIDSIDDLGDVTITGPANGEVLQFNSSSGQWENGPAPGGGGGTVTQVDGGAGLTGSVTTSGALDVGAGTGITVGSSSVSINRAVTDTWYGTVTSVVGGNGLTGTVTSSGSLNVGAGAGITVGADDVRINRTTTDSWYYTQDAADAAFATAAQGTLADSAVQPTDSINVLADVTITSPAPDQVLKWNGSAWVNDAAPGGGGGTVTEVATGAGLSGGPINTSGTITLDTGFTDGRYYTQSAADAAFATAAQGTLADSGVQPTDSISVLTDVTITSPVADQLLTWNGSAWVNADAPAGGAGTVTQVNTGTGLSGGPITDSGTVVLDTVFTDDRYYVKATADTTFLSSDISTYTPL